MPDKQFSKGDLVRFHHGVRMRQGVVKEDRGPIGVKGRHLYLIQYKPEPGVQSEVELPADELEHIQDTMSLDTVS